MKVCSVCQRCYEDDVLSCAEENHEALVEARAASCEIIPNYRLEFLHESTSSGETYRAVNTILKKPYLIKILSPELFDENSKKQFLRETKALSAVVHPNVARVFESGTLTDGSLYAVTEFFTAQTLRECLENVGAPSEVTALTIVRQSAEGLEAIHAAGARHRNIRPENIILTADAENRFLVKLQNIDFGAIHQKQVNSNAELYLSDLRYFSPEQCAAKETDTRSDVYALGVVLYETLAGHVPFDSPYADALIAKQINELPPPVKINSFDIRMLLTHTLTDALQKQERTRLKSANALTRQLRHIEQLATHSSTPPPAVAYPATMVKAAVAFTPTVKIENPVAAEFKSLVEELPLVKTQAVIEDIPPVIENQIAAENQPAIEEILPAEENQIAADELTLAENPVVIEENPFKLETQTAIEESLPEVENQFDAEELSLVEEAPVIEEKSPLIEMAVEENLPVVEAQTIFENLPETKTFVEEEQAAVEAQTVLEAPVEMPTAVENPVEIETQASVEDFSPVETQTVVEEVTPPAVETQTVIEDFAPVEELAPVEIQTAAAEPELPAPVVIDLTTTKLPPIESVIEKPLPENIKITEITPIFTLKSKVSDIHKTNEPVLIKWEQPDDVPTITQALDAKTKEDADTEFASGADFIDDEDYIIDAGEIDEPISTVSKGYEYRRDYAAELPVFSNYDSGASWNLPDNRKVLTGVGVVALIVLAVGGTLLSRQFQLAGATSKTTAQSTPNVTSLPKSAEPNAVLENNKLSTRKTENLTVNNPASNDDTAVVVPEIPDYQPRETDTKTRTKKRVLKETSEKSGNTADTNIVSNETFDKKGNKKSLPDKQSDVKSQTPTKPKIEIFSRPRIVRNPKN